MSGLTRAARLLDATTFRAILRGLGRDAGNFEPPDDPDPTLTELADRPFESTVEVVDRLSGLEERLRERGDRRAVFLTIYVRMTKEVHGGIERGTFVDPAWMRRYLVTFANYYRRAFLAFERGELGDVPDPWRIAFGTAIRGDALVIQDSFLGVNAHINYDLALALDSIGIDPHRAQKYADHRAINDILARLVDVQQEALASIYASGVDEIDAAFGRLDESFTLLSMTEGRERAWRVATVLADAGWPPIPSYARWVLRATATGGALFVLSPALDSSLLRTLRGMETDGLDFETVLERMRARMDEAA